jgi:hypothetical protein
MLNLMKRTEVDFREINFAHTAIVLGVIIKHFVVGVGGAGPDGRAAHALGLAFA